MVQPYRHIVSGAPARAAPIDRVSAPYRKIIGGTEYILSRRLCSFRSKSIEGRKLSQELVRAFILETSSASSHLNPGAFATVTGSTLNVWTWDRNDLAGFLPPSACRQAVPETLYHRPVEGFALRKCIEGVEGQWWQRGALVASRWWPEPPSPSEWALFQRGAGSATSQDEFERPALTQGLDKAARRPRNLTPLSDRIGLISPREFAVIIASIVSVPAIYFIASAANLTYEAMNLNRQKAQLEAAVAGRAELSRDIAGTSRQLSAFQGLFRTNDPLSALQQAVNEVVKRQGEVQQLSFEDGRLNVQFEVKGQLSERDFVSALESTSTLKDVTLSRQGDSNIWTFEASEIPGGSDSP